MLDYPKERGRATPNFRSKKNVGKLLDLLAWSLLH